jgi:hypothetical protein
MSYSRALVSMLTVKQIKLSLSLPHQVRIAKLYPPTAGPNGRARRRGNIEQEARDFAEHGKLTLAVE